MSEDKWKGLRAKLNEESWPALYLFKFIAPNKEEIIQEILGFFEKESDHWLTPSKKGNYTSISVKEVMLSADAVIEKYEKASKIKGVIIL